MTRLQETLTANLFDLPPLTGETTSKTVNPEG